MSSQFANGINIGGLSGGGTSNHAQLTNLDFASSGHTGFMTSANYLPNGTAIELKADGSGDFATLKAAVDYLSGKWSDGVININLGSGTFDTNIAGAGDPLYLNGALFNIPLVIINGAGMDSTIVTNSFGNNDVFRCFNNFKGQIRNLTIGDGTTTYNKAISLSQVSFVTIRNIKAKKCGSGLFVERNAGIVAVDTSVAFENCTKGINVECAGNITSAEGCSITFNACETAFSVLNGGQIHLFSPNVTYTSVTNKTNQAVGTATNNGWITGVTV